MTALEIQQPVLLPVEKPFRLIPVGLKEAALDSPTFRATATHFADQIEAVERWLENYVRSASKLTQEAGTLETVIHTLLDNSAPPTQLSEAVLDHDYTVLAMERFGDGAQQFWTNVIGAMKKSQISVIEPVRTFLSNDTKAFKDARRSLESTQRHYDGLISRYFGQVKSKEPSALREDAFQLHEAKRAYLKASMDFSVLAPQLVATLNTLLIKIFSEQWFDMKDVSQVANLPFTKSPGEFTRIREWSKDTAQGDRNFKYELLTARKEIEEAALNASRPPRDLDYYAASTVPYLGARPPPVALSLDGAPTSKQGWLFLRTITGKPSRTVWIRRWFFVNNGIFGSLVQGTRSGGVEESEKIGVLLCSIRPAFQEERRFCFEVKTKDTTILLQAESQAELTQWIEVFDASKRKALDEPADKDPLASASNQISDAAFAVSPAVAPELAAKRADGQVAHISDDVHGSSHLSDAEVGPSTVSRHSTDVSTIRKASEKIEGERNRDHAARIIQKLDIHRKSTATSQTSLGPNSVAPASPGVASLISASHSALPVGPVRTESSPAVEKKETIKIGQGSRSLAPSTLANPPAMTNLSKTTVIIGAERGLDLGVVDQGGGVPSSIMANQWGTTNYGHISRLERGEVKPVERPGTSSAATTPHMRGISDPPALSEAAEPTAQPEAALQLSPPSSPPRTRAGSATGHHRQSSGDHEPTLPQRRLQGGVAEFPPFYPQELKAHDAQFRLLFPNVPQEDRVVLVFRASWTPEERQELPGRLYVTLNYIYFYSNHYGFVLVSGVALSSILSVTYSKSEGHDLLYLRIEGRGGREDLTHLTIKTFLEPAKLLQRRLDFLATNCSAEEPEGLEEVLRTLVDLETNQAYETYESGDDVFGLNTKNASQRTGINLKVDRSLTFGADTTAAATDGDPIKFRLPDQPVVYTPKDMDDVAAEATFDISAKALFHIMFGDKSVLSQMLYRERRSEAVKQFPWTKDSEGCWTRNFEYEADASTSRRRTRKVFVVDWQTVDITNDHLCYVVTDVKTPWHLPYAKNFTMMSKFVITHLAKSRSSLRVFTKVQWLRPAMLYRNLIQRYAINDLRMDSQDILALVSDQVQKLGPDCTTKKAIHIFGHIGHQAEGAVITSTDGSTQVRPIRVMIRQHNMTMLIFETLASFAASAVSTILMTVIGTLRGFLSLFNAHKVLVSLLLVSLSIQFMTSTTTVSNWWRDRSAADFMSRIGVGPNTALSKAIYLNDLNDAIIAKSASNRGSDSKCSRSFHDIISYSDIDSPANSGKEMYTSGSARSTSRRLRRTRQRMGAYRHDLMVALRLVNGIETEAIQAEYEHWLLEETSKCRKIGAVLSEASDTSEASNSTASKLVAQLGTGNIAHVMAWHDDYCSSCYSELKAATSDSPSIKLT